MATKLWLSDKAQEYLTKFCAERVQGRSGKLQWDSFLVHALVPESSPPPAVDLYDWLQEHLDNGQDVQSLIEDYQRIEGLFVRWKEVASKIAGNGSQFTQKCELPEEFSNSPTLGGLPLGTFAESNTSSGGEQVCSLSPEMRRVNPHIFVVGRKNSGKTSLLSKMATFDIECADRAVVAIDSDGALVEFIRRWVALQTNAYELQKRIVVLDTGSEKLIHTYNPIAVPDDGDWQSIAAAAVSACKATFREPLGASIHWNQQTANILRNCVLLLMANQKTLKDLPAILLDNDFRDVLLEAVERKKSEKVEFISLLEVWHQYKRLSRSDHWINWVEPILTQFNPILGDPTTRAILASQQSSIDLKGLIKDRKILLVRVAREHQNLLGSILVTGLKHAYTSVRVENAITNPVSLYLDEMDKFINTDTTQSLTQETKNSQVGLIGAMRSLSSLPESHVSSILTNFGTVAAFALEEEDAKILAPKFFALDAERIRRFGLPIADQEKLNIDALIRQKPRSFFINLASSVTGAFPVNAPEFSVESRV